MRFITIIFYFFILSAGNKADELKSLTSYEKFSEICSDKNFVIKANNANILCINGDIDKYKSEFITNLNLKIKYIVIKSQGGDVLSSIDIGNFVKKNQSIIVVNGFCVSSCANYIIPAAKSVAVLKNSFIAQHGSPPDNFMEYSVGKVISKNITEREFQSILKKYNGYKISILENERKYFDSIFIDRNYILRYKDIIRNYKNTLGYNCKSYKDIFYIIDKEYLENFGINVVFWGSDVQIGNFSVVSENFPDVNIIAGTNKFTYKTLNFPGENCSP